MAKSEYKEKLQSNKKETRRVLDATVESISKTYDDEIRILKKKNKESGIFLQELKRANVHKDGEVSPDYCRSCCYKNG